MSPARGSVECQVQNKQQKVRAGLTSTSTRTQKKPKYFTVTTTEDFWLMKNSELAFAIERAQQCMAQ